MSKPVQLDLFSGIGGFSLAGHWAGFETIAFCEREPYCQRVLAKHWPGVHCFDDITTLTVELVRGVHAGPIDLITGGFPCQDISAAGRGEGISGSRSSLWFEYLRVIEECRPRWVVIENSPILRIRGADIVLQGLEAAGYTAWASVVGANDAGAPHKRQRVIIVAHRACRRVYAGAERTGWTQGPNTDWGNAGTGLADADSRSIPFEGRRPEGRDRSRSAGEAVANSNSSGRQEQCRAFPVRAEQLPSQCGCSGVGDTDIEPLRSGLCASGPRGERSGRPRDAGCETGHLENASRERSSPIRAEQTGDESSADTVGASSSGAIEPGLGRDSHGLPNRLDIIGWPVRPNETQRPWEPARTGTKISNRAARLKGLGNAVVPQVMYPFLQFIYEQIMISRESEGVHP